jgi:hypothetical protein
MSHNTLNPVDAAGPVDPVDPAKPGRVAIETAGG